MSQQNRVRKLINLDIKNEIISKRESGKSVGHLSAEYGMDKSTIRTVLKNKKEIKSAQVAKRISRLSSSHCNIMELMEILRKDGQTPSN
jgi:lambda repressor-like predicted transcriptional regulator